jgi:Flp pilus assembly protein TadG
MNRKAGTPPETKRITRICGFFRRIGTLRVDGLDAHNEEGASLVEMAIVSGLLLFMVFGIVEVSIGLYTYHYLSDAARDGSRWAMVRGFNSCTNTPSLATSTAEGTYTCPGGALQADISAYVKSLGYWANDPRMTVTAAWYTPSSGTPVSWTACVTAPCNLPGYLVKVNVQYNLPLIVPWWPNGGKVVIQSNSEMVISQ